MTVTMAHLHVSRSGVVVVAPVCGPVTVDLKGRVWLPGLGQFAAAPLLLACLLHSPFVSDCCTQYVVNTSVANVDIGLGKGEINACHRGCDRPTCSFRLTKK